MRPCIFLTTIWNSNVLLLEKDKRKKKVPKIWYKVVTWFASIGFGAAFSHFLSGPGYNSTKLTSPRRGNSLCVFFITWAWGKTNTRPTISSNKRSYSQWCCCEGEILWHMYALPSSSLLPLFYLQQLRSKIWSPLPVGWPMHWSCMLLNSISITLLSFKFLTVLAKLFFIIFCTCAA